MFFEQMVSSEDHTWGADSALGPTVFEEALLDRVEFLVDGYAFDGGDLGSFGLEDWDQAGVDEVSVDDDSAGSALAFSAAFFGPGEVEVFAEDVEEAL
jgi:hypothetical protein